MDKQVVKKIITEILLAFACCLQLQAQVIDGISAKKIMARADSIYEKLPDSCRDFLKGHNVYAEEQHHFVRAALQDWRLYQHILNVFGHDLVDIYMEPDATENRGYTRRSLFEDPLPEKFYPLKTDQKGSGSYVLYTTAMGLTANHNDLCERADYTGDYKEYRAYFGKDKKSYDVRRMQPLVDLHRYPDRYAYLASKDDSVNLYNSTWLIDAAKEANKISTLQALLREKQSTIGVHHPCYALTLSDLATLYTHKATCDYDKAIRLQKEAIAIYQKTGCQEAIQLAVRQLSYLYNQRIKNSPYNTHAEIKQGCLWIQEELDIITPILGSDADEVTLAHKELRMWEGWRQSAARKEARTQIDSIYNHMTASEKLRVRHMIEDVLTPLYYTETNHHYVRTSMMGRKLLNEIIGIFGKEVCDTIIHLFHYQHESGYDKAKITGLVDYALNRIIFDQSSMDFRVDKALGDEARNRYTGPTHKQFDLSLAQAVLDAHSYPDRYDYLTAKDDTLALLDFGGKAKWPNQSMDYARQLLDEKQRTIGKKHPGYALTLSDMAHIVMSKGRRMETDELGRDSLFRQACQLQREAMQIYKNLQLTTCHKMATQTLSYIYSQWRGYSNSYYDYLPLSGKRKRFFMQLKQEELSIIQPILGDSALEVMVCKAEIERQNEFDSDNKKLRYETYGDSIFTAAVQLFRAGQYDKALTELDNLQKTEDDKYRYLPIRKRYVTQWMAACLLKIGETAQARKLDPYCELLPIDRTKTVELDYLCTFEPENPQLVSIARDSLGAGSLEYARMLLQVSSILLQKENYMLTVDYLLQAKTICHEVLGDDSHVYAQLLHRLGNLYLSIGFYQEAALTLEESVALQKRKNDPQSSPYQSTLDQLIKVSKTLKDNKRIIQWSKEKLETDTTITVKDQYKLMESIAEALTAKNGNNTRDTASIRQAINYLHQSIAIRTKELEKTYPKVLDVNDADLSSYIYARREIEGVRINLMHYYYIIGDTAEVLRTEKECIGWLLDYKEKFPGDHIKFASITYILNYYGILSNLTILCYKLTNLHQGRNCRREIELIELAQKLNKDKYQVRLLLWDNLTYDAIDYTIDIFNGLALRELKRYEESTLMMQKALRFREEMDGGKKRMYYSPIRFLISNLNQLGRHEEAAALLSEWWQYLSNSTLKQLVVMNGPQREQYWNQQKRNFESTIPSQTLQTGKTQMLGMLYDNALLTKGLLLNTEMEIDRIINDNGTQEQVALYHQLHHDQLVLMNELQKPKGTRTIDTDSLRASIRTQEHKLLGTFQQDKSDEIISSLRTSWTDIQRHLHKNDVAVEFIAVSMGNDSTVFYALTLRQGYNQPHLIQLFNNKELRAVEKSEYYNTSRLFDMIWRPLQNDLDGAINIYFSPIGALHQIGIEYLPGMENYNTYRLSSTRELIQTAIHRKGDFEAALYGGLKFELSDDERAAQTTKHKAETTQAFRDTPDLKRLRELRGAEPDMPVLEGSLREVQDIDRLMHQKHIHVTTAIGTDGTEESFKALSGQHKSIIHISTHGFYQPEEQMTGGDDDFGALLGNSQQAQTQEDRSLSRSGLLMTGAADYIYGRDADFSTDDGILTAREISRMDLSGLDLVVLSACETGLGDVSGEGVFGLQRGFKKAGAQTLLVSLWKVEDDATQLLMISFYRNLLAGQTKRQAFLKAQRELRQAEGGRFDRYECWAAFVMIDGIN